MAILKLKLDTRSKRAKALLDYLLSLANNDKTIQIEWEEKTESFNKETQDAIKDSKNGKIKKYKNSTELFNELGI
ncbi:MAG: hypothetical protein KAI79_15660 [Bacteroidales bacterium]|nr:hypothetical protein [Bacteroidales bacterium]